MAIDIVRLKKGMLAYAKKNDIDVPPEFVKFIDQDSWGEAAKKVAWRITGHLGWKQSTARSIPLQKAMLKYEPKPKPQPKPKFEIRHDYHAVHHSGNRFGSALKWIVMHDMEVLGDSAAEGVGNYFEMLSSGGSTNYGLDDNSIQCYLSDNVIPWGAPGANTNGLHVEQAGKASWSEKEWLKHSGTLERAAWLIAKKCREHHLPLKFVDADGLRRGERGVTTHSECTKAFGGSHTDPGPHYPMKHVLGLAKKY